MWCCSPTTFSGQYQTPKRRAFGQKASGFRMNDKEKIKETLRMLDDLERYADSLNVGTKMLKKSLQKIRDVLNS